METLAATKRKTHSSNDEQHTAHSTPGTIRKLAPRAREDKDLDR
jgi:hypothetical protein